MAIAQVVRQAGPLTTDEMSIGGCRRREEVDHIARPCNNRAQISLPAEDVMARAYQKCTAIFFDGSEVFAAAVAKHLDRINTLTSGAKLFRAVEQTGRKLTIKMADTSGNSASFAYAGTPLLVHAILTTDGVMFKNELNAAIGQAKKTGMTLEHLAKQLSEGLTPVTYRAVANVVRPQSKVAAPAGANAEAVMAAHAHATMKAMGTLQDLMDGRLPLDQLPQDWSADLPRVLRPWLTPGRGADTTISFDPGDWKPCALDPAMKNRHPALGLVHEMIHGYHNAVGRFMRVRRNSQDLEEVITTGLPPYQYEPFSDNLFRTEFGPEVALRMKY
jgi:hypothetical protein